MSVLVAAPTARPADPATPARTAWPWLLLAGWLAHACLRLWLARHRIGPVANPDESGYLVAARWLAGGAGGDLSGHTFYQGGYALLLAPAQLLTNDPATVYRLAMGINALAGAAVFPLGHLTLRRLGLSRRSAAALAFAAALLPAVLLFGRHTLADAILPVLVLGWLLALDRFAGDGNVRSAVTAGLAASYTFAVHSRGSVVLVVHVAALLWLLRRKPRGALLGLATTVAGSAAAFTLNSRLLAALYPDGARDLGGNLVTRLTTLDGQAWALSGAAGQIWYLITSTWGLAGAGLVAVATAAVRRTESRLMATVLLTVTGGIAYASSAALPDEHRVGNFAYGRYLACLALVYTLIGLVALGRRSRSALGAAVVLILTALWVRSYAGDRLQTHKFIAFDFPEIGFLTRDDGAFRLTTATLAALALLGAFAVLGRLGATALLILNITAAVIIMHPFAPAETPAPPPLPGPAAGGVAIDRAVPWEVLTGLYYPVWWTRIERFDARKEQPSPGICTVIVADAGWPEHPPGWRPYPARSWVAWRAPACT